MRGLKKSPLEGIFIWFPVGGVEVGDFVREIGYKKLVKFCRENWVIRGRSTKLLVNLVDYWLCILDFS